MSPNLQIGFLVTAGFSGLIALGVTCATQGIKFDGLMMMIALAIAITVFWRVSLIKPEILD